VAYHSLDFVASSYALAESTVGLRFRWLIKGIYAAGLWMVVLGILSVLARVRSSSCSADGLPTK
jgi:hypothetical protein